MPRRKGESARRVHVYQLSDRAFRGRRGKFTAKKGVHVVFEHVGAQTFNGSLLCLKRGRRLRHPGSTSGPSITFNLMQLFQQQYRIIGSFGAAMRKHPREPRQMADGLLPVIDTEVPLAEFERRGSARLKHGRCSERSSSALTATRSASIMSLRGRRVGRTAQSRGRRRARRPRRRHVPHAARHRSPAYGGFRRRLHLRTLGRD